MNTTSNHPRERFLVWAVVVLGALATAQSGRAQSQVRVISGPAPAATGYGEYSVDTGDDIGAQERAEVQQRVDRNLEMLQANGALAEPGARAITSLQWPLAAAPSLNSFDYYSIANYVDEDPTSALLDYNCGGRVYNGHRGTDIITWPFAWNKVDLDQVYVIAAAPGTIVEKVGNLDDRGCAANNTPGNHILIRHADTTVAWYYHMKKDSLTDKNVGDAVATGEYLGVVASSGSSTAPHLHFELNDSSGNVIDPWSGTCGNSSSWWAAQRPYLDPRLNEMTTGGAAPVLNPCPNPDVPNARSWFEAGNWVYFADYYRDNNPAQTSVHTIYRPDNSVYTSWNETHSGHAQISYTYWIFGIGGPSGTWRYENVFAGETRTREFQIFGSSLCPEHAVPDCEAPQKSKLSLTFKGGSKDKFGWAFKGTLPTQPSDLGDPTTTTNFHFCVYDSSGSGGQSALKLKAVVPAGSTWEATGKGFKYGDKLLTADGVKSAKLKTGSADKPNVPSFDIKGAGTNLSHATASTLVFPVKAQLLSANGRCWSSTYSTAKKNDGVVFQAKLP